MWLCVEIAAPVTLPSSDRTVDHGRVRSIRLKECSFATDGAAGPRRAAVTGTFDVIVLRSVVKVEVRLASSYLTSCHLSYLQRDESADIASRELPVFSLVRRQVNAAIRGEHQRLFETR